MYYVNPKVSGDQKLTAAADLITIYPNPTGDFININAAEGFLSVSVHNMSGQRLINHNGNLKRVDVQSISNGIYLLGIKTKTQIITEKFIKR